MRTEYEINLLRSRQKVLDVLRSVRGAPVVDIGQYSLARLKLELCDTLLYEHRKAIQENLNNNFA